MYPPVVPHLLRFYFEHPELAAGGGDGEGDGADSYRQLRAVTVHADRSWQLPAGSEHVGVLGMLNHPTLRSGPSVPLMGVWV